MRKRRLSGGVFVRGRRPGEDRSLLSLVVPFLQPVEQLDETVRHRLLYEIVVHRPEMIADALLNDAIEAGF